MPYQDAKRVKHSNPDVNRADHGTSPCHPAESRQLACAAANLVVDDTVIRQISA